MHNRVLFLDKISTGHTHVYFNSAFIVTQEEDGDYDIYANTFGAIGNKLAKFPSITQLLKSRKIYWLRAHDKYIWLMVIRRVMGAKDCLVIHNDLSNSALRKTLTLNILSRIVNLIVLESRISKVDVDPRIMRLQHPILPLELMPIQESPINRKYGVFGRHRKSKSEEGLSNLNYYKAFAGSKIIIVNTEIISNRGSGILAECETYNKPVKLI